MLNEQKTLGASQKVLSTYVALATGPGGTVLAASTTGKKYRVVGAEISLAGAGSVTLYHGTSVSAAKMIAAAQLASGVPLVPTLGDWAPQVAAANEAISADVLGAAAWICIKYIEME